MATVEHIDRLIDARELIDARLRLSIVAALTNLTSGTLRKLWKDVHGVRPPNGKLPESVLSFITNVRADADIAAFLSLYQRLNGDFEVDSRRLLKAWAAHQQLCGPLDINAAFHALRDVRAKLVSFIRCPKCHASYIYDTALTLTSRCPFCATSPI